MEKTADGKEIFVQYLFKLKKQVKVIQYFVQKKK